MMAVAMTLIVRSCTKWSPLVAVAVSGPSRWQEHPLVLAVLLAIALVSLTWLKRSLDQRHTFWSQGNKWQ